MMVLFARLILRPAWREPVRTALTVLAVALGVAAVVAIDLAGQSAATSFHSSLESLTGSADAQLTATGGLDERVLGKLVQLPFAFTFVPRIEDFATVNGRGEAIPFIGLDLVATANLHMGLETPPRVASIDTPDPVWVGSGTGLKQGQTLDLLINDRHHPFTVEGVIAKGKSDLVEPVFILCDIGVAQKVTGKAGHLDSILVKLPPGGSFQEWERTLRHVLPVSVQMAPQGARTEENRKMLAAFRWNLRILSYIALLVGAFLIYNTISISVVRRRAEIGIARALGATKRIVVFAFLGEALCFAAVGSVAGLALGRGMAIGAVRLVGTTVNALYVTSQAAPLGMNMEAVVNGLGLGFAVSVLAALLPAMEAGRVQPVEAMARGRADFTATVHSGRNGLLALLALGAACVCAAMPPLNHQPLFGYLSVLLLVAGASLSTPALVLLFSRLVQVKLFGIEALLAMRSLRGSLIRTAVLTSALATAIAMTASVAVMVGSFRETVWVWMNNGLKADLYLRPAGTAAADRHPTIDPSLADRIERLPGVSFVDRYREYAITYDRAPATLAGGESSVIRRTDSTRFLPGEDRDSILGKLPTGDYVVVSEPFANKHNVRVGDTLQLPLGNGLHAFRVLGIYYDYSTERGFIMMDRRTLMRYLHDPHLSALAVYLTPGADVDAMRNRVDGVLDGHALLVVTNRALRRAAIQVFDRTFSITYAIEAVSIFVAIIGIAGSLLALVIDRRREFALLRFLGASQPQTRRLILTEAALLGALATAIGLVLGLALSLILIFVINKQSFGWTIQFHYPALLLLEALLGIYAATVLAGLYPARIALRLRPIEVIHEE